MSQWGKDIKFNCRWLDGSLWKELMVHCKESNGFVLTLAFAELLILHQGENRRVLAVVSKWTPADANSHLNRYKILFWEQEIIENTEQLNARYIIFSRKLLCFFNILVLTCVNLHSRRWYIWSSWLKSFVVFGYQTHEY